MMFSLSLRFVLGHIRQITLLSLHVPACQGWRQTQSPPWLSGQYRRQLQSLARDLSSSGCPACHTPCCPRIQHKVRLLWPSHSVKARVGMSFLLVRPPQRPVLVNPLLGLQFRLWGRAYSNHGTIQEYCSYMTTAFIQTSAGP